MLLFFFFQNTINGGPCIITSAPVSPQYLLISGFLFCGLNAFAVLVLCRRSTVQPRDPARGQRALPQTAGPQHRQIQNGLLWCKWASCTIKCTLFYCFWTPLHDFSPLFNLRLYWVNIYGWNHILSLCFGTYLYAKKNITFSEPGIGIN